MDIYSESVDVCVVCALPEEARVFREVALQQGKGRSEEHTSPRYKYGYRLIFLKNGKKECFTVHLSCPPRYGPQEMILHLSHVLEEYQPLLVLMTGICAGDPQRVHLGDLVVADRLFTYDNGKVLLDEQGRRLHEPDTITYQPPASILQYLGLFDAWQNRVRRLKRPPHALEPDLKVRDVCRHIKAIASGSAVREDHPFEEIRVPVRGTVAIDMEGAAFGLVMSHHPLIPWLVVKGVCDYADQNKDDHYHDYAARVSSLYALCFLQAYATREKLLSSAGFAILSQERSSRLWSRWFSHDPVVIAEQNRIRMLERLQCDYREMLLQSLEGVTWIELAFRQKPRCVSTAAQIAFRLPYRPESELPSDTTILQVYADAQGELLVLGQPGAGKSTLLLCLALELVKQAWKDVMLPLPILLPLSNWAGTQQTIREWSKGQIAQIYGISEQVCDQWMQHNQFLLLLDGLDEMEEEAIPKCIDAINDYHRLFPNQLIVSSREAEYLGASKRRRLFLHQAVLVRPLTKEQIDQHLAQMGAPLAALREEVRVHTDLQDLATTPLMLNILMLTYYDKSIASVSEEGKPLREQVLDHYVQRMVECKGDINRFPPESMNRWLGWLGGQLQRHNQKIFYLEKLQPDWLPATQQRKYDWLAVRFPGVFIGVLAGLLPTSLLLTFSPGLVLQYSILSGFLGEVFSVSQKNLTSSKALPLLRGLFEHFTLGRITGSAFLALVWSVVFISNLYVSNPSTSWLLQTRAGVISGLAIGLSGLLFMILLPLLPKVEEQKSKWMDFQCAFRQVFRSLLAAVLFGSAIWLSDSFSEALNNGPNGMLYYGLSNGLSSAFSYAFLGIIVSVILGRLTEDIHLTERLKWTCKSLRQSLFNIRHILSTFVFVLVSMVCFGLAQGVGPWLNQGVDQGMDWGLGWGLRQGLSWGLSCALICWLVFGLFQGISQEQIEEQKSRQFNQGIHNSFRNSVVMSILSLFFLWPLCILGWGLSYMSSYGLIYGGELSSPLMYELYSGFSNGLQQGLSYAWLFTISGSLLIGITLSGGLAILRHYILRYLLQHLDKFPWDAHSFLEDACQRNLLCCIDGKYSFPHSLLQDHFADHEVRSITEDTEC